MLARDKRKFKSLVPTAEPLLSGYDPVSTNTCISCGRVHIGKRWVKQDDHFEKSVLKALHTNREATILSTDVEETPEGAHIIVTGKLHGQTISEEYDVPVQQLQGTCTDCGKSDENYFEGALQLRNCSKEVLDKVSQLLKQYESRGMFTNKISAYDKENIDIKLSKQKYIKTLAKDLQKLFGGTVQNDAKLFSYNPMRSKNVYRVNVTYTAFPFCRNVIIIDKQNEPFRVVSIQKVATIQHLTKSESRVIDAVQAKEYQQVVPQKVTITRTGEKTYALHPTTFQETLVHGVVNMKNPKVYVVGSELYSLE